MYGLILLVAMAAEPEVEVEPAPPAARDGVFAPPTDKRRARATRVNDAPNIDGVLDEPAWQRAPSVGDFVVVEPQQGTTPQVRTTVRVLFDDRALYLGARCDDPAGVRGIQQRDLRRDFDLGSSDFFGVSLDTVGDGRNAYAFYVNPWGAQLDMQVIDDELFEDKWDTVWRSAVKRDPTGWTVEFAIPWKSLRTVKGRTEWGFQLARQSRRLNELSAWSPFPRAYSPFRMSYAGVLDGLEPAAPRLLDVQLRPYGIVRLGRVGDGAVTAVPTLGGEVTWQPNANTVVDLTANTDFAETDVDRLVVNLSRFNVFFPERRQFFLENAGVFSPGDQGFLMPFFSRSIGLSPNADPVPINVGGRVISRSTENSFGALVVNTAPTATAQGSLFGVARYMHNLGDESHAGGMLVVRQDFATGSLMPSTNVVPVVDALARFGPLSFDAMATGSVTQDGTAAPRFGGAGLLSANVQGNWGFVRLATTGLSPDYDARAGFVSRPEVLSNFAEWFFDLRPAWLPWWLRSMHQYGEAYLITSTRDGSFQEANVYLEPVWVRSKWGDRFWVSAQHSWQAIGEVFEPVPGLAVPKGHYEFDQFGVAAYSEPSRVVSAGFNLIGGRYYRADGVHLSTQAGVQPIPHVSLFFRYEYNRFTGQDAAPAGATTHLLLGEARLALNPKLQLIGSYQRDTAGNVGIVNARLAWEFLPLSFVYVVFTDSRNAFPQVGQAAAEQKFVVKLTYTWRP